MSEPAFPDLRAFLDELTRERDLVVVEAEVDARLEVAEIHRRVIAAGGPALLFTRVRGAAFPLVTNLFGTARRAELAFGAGRCGSSGALVELAADAAAADAREAVGRARRRPGRPCASGSRGVAAGRSREVVTRDVRLDRLPALTCWPEDGGPFVTLPLVYTEHPDAPGRSNLGMYRMQVHDARTTGMHWQIGKGGGFHYAVAEARGERAAGDRVPRRPAGADPRGDRAAAGERAGADARLADRGRAARALPRARARTRSSRAPSSRSSATCRRACAGPRGRSATTTATTRCATTTRCSRSSSSCHRRDAIYPATVVGKPRQEDFFIGDLLQELLSPLFPLVMPASSTSGRTARPATTRWRRRSCKRALQARGDGLGVPHPRRGAALADEVPAGDRPAASTCATSARRSSTCSRARDPRPTSTCSRTSRWTRSTTPGPRSTRARRACGWASATRCASCRASSGRPSRRRREVTRRARVLRRLPRRRRRRLRPRSPRRPRASPRTRPSRAGRCSCSPTSRRAPPRAR